MKSVKALVFLNSLLLVFLLSILRLSWFFDVAIAILIITLMWYYMDKIVQFLLIRRNLYFMLTVVLITNIVLVILYFYYNQKADASLMAFQKSILNPSTSLKKDLLPSENYLGIKNVLGSLEVLAFMYLFYFMLRIVGLNKDNVR